MDWDNPWIVLLKVWISALRGQSMDCTAFAQSMDCATIHAASSVREKEQREQGDQSRERKVNRGPFGWRSSLQFLGESLLDLSLIVSAVLLDDYPALGLRNILCLPVLWSLDCTLLSVFRML